MARRRARRIHAGRPPSKALHVIALRYVFEYLSPPPGLLERSITAGPQSPWFRATRTLKSIALVCKSWHTAAYPLLYRNVILIRVGQVAAFARTIRNSPEAFVPHVRNLTLRCEIPPQCLSATRQSLACVFEHCTALKSISFQASFPFALVLSSDSDPTTFGPNMSLPMGITSMGLYDDVYPDYHRPLFHLAIPTDPIFSALSSLVSLSINTCCGAINLGNNTLELPQLESLTVWIYDKPNGTPSELAVDGWNMPKLCGLRIRPTTHEMIPEICEEVVIPCCQKFGAQLINLDLDIGRLLPAGIPRPPPMVMDLYSEAIDLCPRLEHLVIRVDHSSASVNDFPQAFLSRPINHVDIIVDSDSGQWNHEGSPLDFHSKSQWKFVRYVDSRLTIWIPDLLYLPHLTSDPNQPYRVVDSYGLKVVESGREIYMEDLSVYEQGSSIKVHKADDTSDSESTSDSSGYGSSDEGDTEPDEPQALDGQPFYNTPIEPLTEEDILEIFSGTTEEFDGPALLSFG